jgi:hypothetical protein
MKIQWIDLPPRKFIVNNITVLCLKRRTLWLYDTSIDELVSLTSDNEIHTLTLCEPEDLAHFTHILGKFSSLIKLQLIRVMLNESLLNQDISLLNLVTLSIIECDLTDCDLDDWMLSLDNLQKLRWVNNRWNTNVNQIIGLIKSKALLIDTTTSCGMEVSIK